MSCISEHFFKMIVPVLMGVSVPLCGGVSLAVSAEPLSSETEPSVIHTAEQSEGNRNETEVHDNNEAALGDTVLSSLDLFRNGGDYSAVLYNNTNGLTTSEANAIAQTSDGFLWIGSYGGLVRYDGNKFEQIEIDKTMSGVKSLFVDSRDNLWIGSANNGVAVMDKGQLTYWYESDGLPEGSVNVIQEDDSGIIYVAAREGLVTIDSTLELAKFDDKRINDQQIIDIKKGDGGRLYCLSDEGDVFTIKNGEITNYRMTSIDYGFTCLVPHPNDPDHVFLAQRHYLYDLDLTKRTDDDHYGDTAPEELEHFALDETQYIQDIECINGRIWVCSDTGIGIHSVEDGTFYKLDDVPMTGSVEHVMRDYQGNYWFSSTRLGVMKLVPNRFRNVLVRYGLSEKVVNTTCMVDNTLFVGTDTGLVVIDSNGIRDSYPVRNVFSADRAYGKADLINDLLAKVRIRSIVYDSKNRLWFSTWGSGLMCLEQDTLFQYTSEDTQNTSSLGLISDNIRTIHEREDGSICAIGAGGMSVIQNRQVVQNYGTKDGIKDTSILTIAENSNGDILLGSDGGGLYIINDTGVKTIGTKEGLSSGIVMRIKKDRTRDLFWLVTNNSVSYMTKDYKLKMVTSFPYTNNFDVYQNSKDEIWVLSSNGIYVVPTEQMIADKVTTLVHYTAMNGLPCITTANSYSELTDSGDLYIAGTAGVVRVNIESSKSESVESKSSIPYLDADGVRVYPDYDGSFHVASRVKKITIYSYVMNYSLTDLMVSYRLDGFDERTTSLNAEELIPVDYTNLPGGDYSFVLDVTDSMSTKHHTLRVKITKEKAIYEEVWFWIPVAIIGLLLVVGTTMLIMFFRMKKIRKKNRDNMTLIHEITEAFAKVIDMKDTYTNGHSSRVAMYTAMLAEELGCNKETVERYYHVALLHDIGKVGVPSAVLNKPGKLTDTEFELIKTHTSMGYGTLEGISIMPELALGAKYHHERPDGKGYPDHLKGDEIPRVAQIIAVADCFDAMYSNRPYRKRMNFEKAVAIIKEAAGTQLTADVVEAFSRLVDKG